MKRDRTQRRLDQLYAIRHSPTAAGAAEILREALGDASNHVVSRAVAIIEQAELRELVPAVVAAYDRFMADPKKLDRGCEAVTACVKALYALDHHEAELYLRGIRHRQLEGALPPTDEAQTLRSICTLGLSQTRYPGVLDEIVLSMTDDSPRVRATACKAVSCLGNGDLCVPLLKLKLYTGDKEVEVLAECMASMLAISVSRCLDTVLLQLDAADRERRESAAIALGSIRDDRAFEGLLAKWKRTATGEVRERILHAMGMSRTEKALEFLTGLAAQEPSRTAIPAAKALLIHRHDSRILEMVRQVALTRPEIAQILMEVEEG